MRNTVKTNAIIKKGITNVQEKSTGKYDLMELDNLTDIDYSNEEHRNVLREALNAFKKDGTNNSIVEVFADYVGQFSRELIMDGDYRLSFDILDSRPTEEYSVVIEKMLTQVDEDGDSKTFPIPSSIISGVYIDTVQLSFRVVNKEWQKITQENQLINN
jgi:Ca2+-binding EF-hand superfamily protein